MEGLIFRKQIVFLIFSALLTAGLFFCVFAQNNDNNPPSALNYAPNFQFDSEEKYYPADPLDFYFENGEEIEGEKAKKKYYNLSFSDKIDNFVVFYHIEDEGDHWVYQYWTFYVFNDNPVWPKNKHYGDWEAVFVSVDKNSKEVIRTVGTAHHRKTFDTEIENPKTNHIWAYVANGSHAICIDEEGDGHCNFLKWRNWEKWDKNGYKSLYNDYKLKEITQEYINNFNGATTLKKSSKLGINVFDFLKISQKEFYIPIGGSPPDYPWAQSMYHNPEETRPYSVKYAGEKIKKVGNGITGFFDDLFAKVGNFFKKPKEFQADISGLIKIQEETSKEPELISEVVLDKVVVSKPAPELIIEEPIIEEPVVQKIKEVSPVSEISLPAEELEIELIEPDEPITQPKPPFGLSSFPGGGSSTETVAETTSTSTAETISVPAPNITSHSINDILGPDNDYSTSTAGFQINLIGTSTQDFLIHITASSTSATTTTDINGDWSKVIDLSEGDNNITVKAEDINGNESENTTLNLIVDTTPPSDISDLSAISGNARGEINLSWTAPGDDESVGTTTQYIIKYATSSAITVDNWASSTDIVSEPNPSIASTTENLIITGLTPSETYYWAIKSEDNAGNTSGLSNCASSSPSAIAENIVISEIAVQRGINRLTDEFIELYNPTDNSINLSGWSIKYASAQSTTTWNYKYFDVDGQATSSLPSFDLASHSYYLLTSATSSSGYSYGAEPDLAAVTTGGSSTYLGLAGAGGKIKLLDDNGETVDLIAWEKDSLGAEGEPVDIDGLTWGSLERKALATSTAELLAVNNAHHWKGNNQDRNNNSQDFVLQTVPNPQNSLSLTEPETTFPVLADTDWPTLQHDIQHSGLGSYIGTATGTPTSTPKWTVNLGNTSPTSPIIGLNGEIYIGAGSGKLYKISINNATGTMELFYDTQTGGTIQTPVITSDGTIYISDNDHYLYALSSEGKLKWKHIILNGSSPTIGSDGAIYVGSSHYGIYALNPNGELIWQSPQLSNGKWVGTPALASDGTIYTVGRIGKSDGNRNVYALDPQDGSILWKSASSTFSTAPALSNDGTIFVGGIYGLYALNSSDGIQKWSLLAPSGMGQIYSIPAIKNNIIYIGTDSHAIRAIDNAKENIEWSFYTGGIISASPIIDANGIIYIGSSDNMFYAFNASGGVEWQAELSDSISHGAVIDSNGTIYIASSDGILYAFGE